MTLVKICGLRTVEEVDAAVEAGAEYLGFNTFARSPRYVDDARLRALLARSAGRSRRVLLFVDPTDAELDAAVALEPDLIQLHGRETPERTAEVRARTGLPVIKALPVGTPGDLDAADAYDADHVMLDARPPAGADRQGGHGVPFDWSLLGSERGVGEALWFLAGGLTPENVGEAIRITRAPVVDVSSGVESAPGVKDPALIRAFIQAVRDADREA